MNALSDMIDVEPDALAEDNGWDESVGDDCRQVESDATGGGSRSKAELMAGLMSDPQTYDKLGPAWRLAIRLLNTGDGKLVGTYEEIARQVGMKKRSRDSIRNWANHLVKNGVAKLDQKKCHVSIKLVGEYMKVAEAPPTFTRTVCITPTEDPRLAALKKMAEGAGALGGRVHVTIEGCSFEANDDGGEA